MSLWRILVVDDEAGMLRSVERVLSQDYELATTRSPREAVEIAKGFKPNLAILDIQMPDLDGFQLMEKLQAMDPDLEVILMTGSVHELDAKLIRLSEETPSTFFKSPSIERSCSALWKDVSSSSAWIIETENIFCG
jgi:CheY-like chemotaxis protein